MVAIVDDDEDVRMALSDLVRSLGYVVTVFETADAFLESTMIEDSDCIISDVHMPGMNGLRLARFIQTTSKPVIMITAFPSLEIERQAADAGVQCFLRKPFDPMVLIDHLSEILG
jgi:FixJ family two-component response regulator